MIPKMIPTRNDPRFSCYQPRNDPQWILGMATKHGTVDRSMIKETKAILAYVVKWFMVHRYEQLKGN